ncbi:MAG: M14 family zinc carboxypeptidase [Phycisphaerae bacterium]
MFRSTQRWALVACVSFSVSAFWASRPAWADEAGRYEGYPVVRVTVETQEQLARVEQMSETIFNDRIGVGPLDVLIAPERLPELDKLGLRYKVIVEDIQIHLDHERASRTMLDLTWFEAYKTYPEILTYLDGLVTSYPDLISKYQIGTSIEGRAIYGLTITSPSGDPDKPALCFNANQHAREWITPPTVVYIADQLVSNYGSDPLVSTLLDELIIYIVPSVNPDGYEYTWLGDDERWWRKNRRNNGDGTYGVDPNRNWGYEWGHDSGSSGDPGSTTYRGPFPFSEPETQALRDFILAHPEIVAHIDFHSYSQLILRPWSWDYLDPPEPDFSILKGLGDDMAQAIYDTHGKVYVSQRGCNLYPASGVCPDWVYGEAGIYSYCFELRPVGAPYFILPPEEIIPTAEENYAAILLMAEYFTQALGFQFPDGLPSTITSGTDTTISVIINNVRESVTPGTPRMYYRYDPSGSFIETPLTFLGVNAYEAVLPATNCMSAPEFYFSADGDGGTTATSPKSAPAEAVYSATVLTAGRVTFFEEDLSSNPVWTTEDQWAWGQPTGGGGEYGGPDPTSGHTGNNVYGYNLSGDYPNNLPERHLTTNTPINCTGLYGVRLSFWRWLGVEEPAYDHAYVRVSNNGTDWVTVWANPVTIADTSWSLQDIDISAVADNQPTVYLRWTMGSTDGGWRYCGWNIDDIELSRGVCEGIAGDYDGDGDVDYDDFEQFELCFTGPGGGVLPECAIFDFDADEDVDCDDWSLFEVIWTGPPVDPPDFAPCEAFAAPTPDAIAKNRYLSFTPGPSQGQPQAFRVTTVSNPLFPETVGWQKWVGPSDADRVARLQCTAHYDNWAFTPVHVGDLDIVPGANYEVEATLDGAAFLPPVAMATVPVWGDVVGEFDEGAWTPPDGVSDFNDISSVVDRFRALPTAPSTERCDMYPAAPNYNVNFDDIAAVVDAFRALPYYPNTPPSPCP